MMTYEELAAIHKRVEFIGEMARITEHKYERYVADDYCRDVPALLVAVEDLWAHIGALKRECERLRAENAALCVAATAVLYPTTAGVFHCYHCRAYVLDATDHAPDCPFTTLRELVEQGEETTR